MKEKSMFLIMGVISILWISIGIVWYWQEGLWTMVAWYLSPFIFPRVEKKHIPKFEFGNGGDPYKLD